MPSGNPKTVPPGSAVRPALQRTMGATGALLITLSNLSPTIGVFVIGSDVIRQAGTGAFLCFAAAALLGIAMANVYAELSSAFPQTGGEYTIVGQVLGPGWGFAILGLNLLTFSTAQAIAGLGAATYLDVIAPGLAPVPTAVALVVIVTATAVLNVRVNALITGLFLAVELIALAVVAALGALHAHRSVAQVVLHPVALGAHGLAPVGITAMAAAAAGAIYAFDGFGSTVYLGEELCEAPRKIARVMFWALGLAAVAMLAPVLAVVVGAPDLKALISAAAPVPAFVRAVGGAGLARLMSLGVALALFNAMIASALMAGRQLYGSGRDRCWPAGLSAGFIRLHRRFNSPWIATLAMGAASVLWCLVDLKTLVMLIGDGTAAIYAALCIAAVRGRRSGASAHAPYRMPLFPALPLAALAALAVVAWADLFDADGRAGLLATLAVIAFSIAYYGVAIRGRGVWAHTAPEPQEDSAP